MCLVMLGLPVGISIIELLKGNKFYWFPLGILTFSAFGLIWFDMQHGN